MKVAGNEGRAKNAFPEETKKNKMMSGKTTSTSSLGGPETIRTLRENRGPWREGVKETFEKKERKRGQREEGRKKECSAPFLLPRGTRKRGGWEREKIPVLLYKGRNPFLLGKGERVPSGEGKKKEKVLRSQGAEGEINEKGNLCGILQVGKGKRRGKVEWNR